MIFVKRDTDGKIVALYQKAIEEGMESLAMNHVDVVAFLNNCDNEQKYAMLRSDLQLIRVIEDVIEILLSKNIINITDFPPTVVEKLMKRRGIRTQLSDAMGIIEEDYDYMDDDSI